MSFFKRIKQYFTYGRQVARSKDGKTLLSNFGWLTALQVAGYIFPLITLPYLARVIGVDGFGKIAFASAVIVWMQTIADWGFDFTATRDVARNREDNDKVSEIFSNVFWARILLVLVSYLVLVVLTISVPKFYEARDVIFVTSLMLIGHILYPAWFFQAMERMKYITILGLIAKLVFTIAVFIFIRDTEDYILQPLFVSLGFIVSGIIALYFIFVRWGVRLKAPTLKAIINTIKGSSDVFVNNLMPNLYNSFSTVLLGLFGNPVQNGLYDAGKKLPTTSCHFLSVISRTFFPYLVRNDQKHASFAKLYLSVAFIVSMLLFAFSKPLLQLFYSDDFLASVPAMRLLSIVPFFIVMNSVYGTNYLLIHNRDKLLRNLTTAASVVGFAIAFPLIKYYGYMGAAWTFAISTTMMGVLPMIASLKIKKNINNEEIDKERN